ncbi:transposable element Tc1 transposase [Trichonephila clavipes]|nr:transposable element Tc1 transposase [Trichonephila clavipes]
MPHREMANNQSVRRHLDAFTRGRIIGKLELGRSLTSVAAESEIAHSIVSRLSRQFQTTRIAIRGFSSGRLRGTTPADDPLHYRPEETSSRQRDKSLDTRRTGSWTATDIAFTLARRLHGGILFARRPVRCVPLTPAHRRRRSVVWKHWNWRETMNGDEYYLQMRSRFSLKAILIAYLIWKAGKPQSSPRTSLKGTGMEVAVFSFGRHHAW